MFANQSFKDAFKTTLSKLSFNIVFFFLSVGTIEVVEDNLIAAETGMLLLMLLVH